MLLDARPLDVATKNFPCAHAGERPSTRIEEENSLALALLEFGSQLAQIHSQGTDGGATDWHEPLFAPLAEDSNEAVLEHQVTNADTDPLGHAKSGTIRKLEHR